MKKTVLSLITVLILSSTSFAITCPAGQIPKCVLMVGSGRYTYCKQWTCVPAPPANCWTAWGTEIDSGSCLELHSTYAPCYPTTCADVATLVCCSDGVLTPNITGSPGCTEQYECGAE